MVIAVVINSDCITVYKFVQKDEISCPKVLHLELYFIDSKFSVTVTCKQCIKVRKWQNKITTKFTKSQRHLFVSHYCCYPDRKLSSFAHLRQLFVH